MLTPEQFRILRARWESLTTSGLGCPVPGLHKACSTYDEYDDFGNQVSDAFDDFFIRPKIISISPDGLYCKLTEYGHALFQETDALQNQWDEAPIIPLDDAEKSQIMIGAGEVFRGKYFVTQLLKRAHTAIRLHDNYCAHELLAWLYGCSAAVKIQVLTSPKGLKQDKTFEPLYRAFKVERVLSEVRITESIHDRRIFIDDRDAFQIGESLKDLGKKGTTIVRLQDVAGHIAQFDVLWNVSKPL